MTDEEAMRRAIALAKAQVGRTGANPAVGCVILAGGEVVGEGATGDGGRPHAEEVALAMAGPAARGSVAYVTLEPCAERSSGALSCSTLLADAGVARVVVACGDPSVYAAGRSCERLHRLGIPYEQGFLAVEAQGLYTEYEPAKVLEIRR